jgi:dipeptidyl aminopeptidase/acylaminoacyl peptidase
MPAMTRVLHRGAIAAIAAFALSASSTAPLRSQGSQATPGWTPDLMMKVKRVSAVEPSPDGKRVAFVVGEALMDGEKSEWLSQTHVANADGSQPIQLTRGDKSSTSPKWSPDGRWLGFVSSRSGKANVWRLNTGGGEAEMITDEKGGVSSFEWSPDGQFIAFLMTDPKSEADEKADKEKRDWRTLDENVKMARLYVAPVEKDKDGKRTSRRLTSADFNVNEFSWSPDGRTIAFSHMPTPSPNDWPKGDISLVTVADASVKPLATSRAAEDSPSFSPDGRWIAFAQSDDPPTWGTTRRAHVMPAGGGTPRPLADTPDSQPNIVDWSADGSRVYVSETDRVTSRIYALPADGGAATAVGPPNLMIGAPTMNAARTMMGFVSPDPDHAQEAYVAAVSQTLSPTQASRVQPAFDAPLGKTDVIAWKSADGTPVEGLITYPVGYQKGARAPLVVIVHGGPAGVFTRTFVGAAGPYPIAAFAANGYAILRCNVRGSSGYGKKFRYANMSDWGGGDYRDIMTGVDHVISMGVADPDRMGVMGWSYGGFMTSWIITQTRRFKAASVGAGVTNLMSFTGTADIPGFVPDYFGGEYWDVFEKWRAHSAMFHVKGVATPTLIQHGEADLRVPVSQGYEFYNALKRQGVTVKMTVYPRQPHGLQEPKMTLDAARANLEWFDKHVRGKTTPPTAAAR